MIKKIYQYFSIPKRLALLNGSLIIFIVLLNFFTQAFCIPPIWTVLLLIICFANTILYPFLKTSKYEFLISFLNGISLCIFIYSAIFLENINLFGLTMLLLGIGIPLAIPYFFIFQLLWTHLIKPIHKRSRYFFIGGIVSCLGIIFFIGQEYKNAISSIEKFKASNYTELDKTFMTERILGMHFIYHTRFCYYDGWRPPKHDPILVIGMWMNNRIDPLDIRLEERLQLYKKFFPENSYKFKCSCAIQYRKDYHNDRLWR